ncbi:MAG: hypothetical protein K2L51_06295, partial [Clostridiales bacterium]|nr:hypothetical protein [Clostridiales bacterium]
MLTYISAAKNPTLTHKRASLPRRADFSLFCARTAFFSADFSVAPYPACYTSAITASAVTPLPVTRI